MDLASYSTAQHSTEQSRSQSGSVAAEDDRKWFVADRNQLDMTGHDTAATRTGWL